LGWDVHDQKGSRYIRPSHLLGPLCCVGEKVKSRYPSDWTTTNVPHTWAGVIPTISVLLGRDVPDHTPTILKQIAILLIIIFNLSLYIYDLFLRLYRLQVYLSNCTPFYAFLFIYKFLMHFVVTLWVWRRY